MDEPQLVWTRVRLDIHLTSAAEAMMENAYLPKSVQGQFAGIEEIHQRCHWAFGLWPVDFIYFFATIIKQVRRLKSARVTFDLNWMPHISFSPPHACWLQLTRQQVRSCAFTEGFLQRVLQRCITACVASSLASKQHTRAASSHQTSQTKKKKKRKCIFFVHC